MARPGDPTLEKDYAIFGWRSAAGRSFAALRMTVLAVKRPERRGMQTFC